MIDLTYKDDTSSDAFHLGWIYNRLVNIHGENPQVDYMLRLKSIVEEKLEETRSGTLKR